MSRRSTYDEKYDSQGYFAPGDVLDDSASGTETTSNEVIDGSPGAGKAIGAKPYEPVDYSKNPYGNSNNEYLKTATPGNTEPTVVKGNRGPTKPSGKKGGNNGGSGAGGGGGNCPCADEKKKQTQTGADIKAKAEQAATTGATGSGTSSTGGGSGSGGASGGGTTSTSGSGGCDCEHEDSVVPPKSRIKEKNNKPSERVTEPKPEEKRVIENLLDGQTNQLNCSSSIIKQLLEQERVNVEDNTRIRKKVIEPVEFGDYNPARPSTMEAAKMSDDAYNSFAERKEIGNGWTRIEHLPGIEFEILRTKSRKEIDFQSALYRKEQNGKVVYVYATAGTASAIDGREDVEQIIGRSEQFSVSIENARKLIRLLPPNAEIIFTGHSLGGGTASANALATGKKAITFNAAGISEATKARHNLRGKKDIKKRITAYIIPGEAVDYYQGMIGLEAEGSHIYIHPVLGRVDDLKAKILKYCPPKTIIERGILHMMMSIFVALNTSGYAK